MNQRIYKLKFIKRKIEGLYQDPERGLFFLTKFLKKFSKQTIGLKSSWRKEQLTTRLPYKPKLIEIYLKNGDLENYLANIEEAIKSLKKKGIKLIIHQPEFYKNKVMTIASIDKNTTRIAEEGYEVLFQLCQKYGLKGFVMHPYSGNLEKIEVKKIFKKLDQKQFFQNLNKNKKWRRKVLLENLTEGFFKTEENMEKTIKNTKIKLCIDLCHLYIIYKDNQKMKKVLNNLKKHIKHYHVVDTTGTAHDSLEIGKGKIDFFNIKENIKEGIIEVNCKDQVKATEMLSSYVELNKMYTSRNFKKHKSRNKEFRKNKEFLININNLIKNFASKAKFF